MPDLKGVAATGLLPSLAQLVLSPGKMVLPDGKVVPPTGKAFDIPDFVQVVKFEGDRVIEIYAIWD